MRPPILLVLAAAFTLGACRGLAPSSPAPQVIANVEERYTILAPSAGPEVFRSCSPTPGAREQWMPDAFWQPDPATVAAIEDRLPMLLDSVLDQMGRQNPLLVQAPPERYLRQYVGFERGGERLVYVNGFNEGLLRILQGAGGRPLLDWRSAVLAPCDSGPAVFGVVYDPRTQSFARLEFAFSFSGPVRY